MSAKTARTGVEGHVPFKDTPLGAKEVYCPILDFEGILIETHGQMYMSRLVAHSIFAHTNSLNIEKEKSHGGPVIMMNALNTKTQR